MLLLKYKKIMHGYKSILGTLTLKDNNKEEFLCFCLEGTNPIENGVYNLGIRDIGGFHSRYISKFNRRSNFHKGMLEVKDVPMRNYILIHIGNTYIDTRGCLLTGTSAYQDDITKEFRVGNSTGAYIRMYEKVISSVLAGNILIEIS